MDGKTADFLQSVECVGQVIEFRIYRLSIDETASAVPQSIDGLNAGLKNVIGWISGLNEKHDGGYLYSRRH